MVELGFSPTPGKYIYSILIIHFFCFVVFLELQRTLIEVSFRVMPFDRFVAAIDQNILTLTQEFVQEVIRG